MELSAGAAIAQLSTEPDGRVLTPGDPGYEAACTPYYGGFDHRPAAVVRPADAAGVARAVAAARDHGVELAVRGGGHSPAGHRLCRGGIVLDLSGLRAVHIDPEARTAWAQAGATAGRYTRAAGAYGLATGFGDTASVGIAGITLGGGAGYLSRKYGLSIDDLLAAELVTADGRTRQVHADSHPDLFWAIRGGGGNFGVATRLKFRLHEVPAVVGGMLILPATAQSIAAFAAEAEAAPEELTTLAAVVPAPPMPFLPAEHHGRLVIMALLCYAGGGEAAERALAPFRRIAAPLTDQLAPTTYPELLPEEEEEFHPTVALRTLFTDRIDRAAAEAIIAHLAASDAPMRVAQIRPMGGAVARVPADATAYAHRTSRVMVNIAASYDDPAQRAARQAWVDDLAAALHRGDDGAYVNFLADEGPGRVRAAYPGATWDRLRVVKRRYDPDNLFHRNQNIPPAPEVA